MKITLNIDEELLDRVVLATRAKTKTEAINTALGEIDRRYRLAALLGEEIDLSPDEWRRAFDENSVVDEGPVARVAEDAPKIKKTNERKPRPRR